MNFLFKDGQSFAVEFIKQMNRILTVNKTRELYTKKKKNLN
jgi:hypothetical protein